MSSTLHMTSECVKCDGEVTGLVVYGPLDGDQYTDWPDECPHCHEELSVYVPSRRDMEPAQSNLSRA